ncbi:MULTISPECIES: GNAT family N-acetyltransferase [Pseudomonas fluorescens group]|uniref:L-ornithine N(alpha)-acyltransferase n=1 Tax=Pseudomonas petroselini TaxID=2899822 RepID=A0ABS8QWH5_9PSED|nr:MULTISPECIES: GNAT family N-acyltransferase [Pseudomonas fluorescens group]MCD7040089.1 GNAT family N-acetyltransferase [Pseudomonas petroselini]MCD7045006.1 GNAT family N-acetyltransferase [Pseudomonas petroselini]MCD7069851.1 GNAT family N-acetyltransferase [Pseudomonas petroselini]MCD7078913.1 GNAT family N-acetyltransferase [Pseudomonas petroselini]MCF5666330.1 GNAT family N-acetyltransferase [Pseudomonas marginalis]
MQPQLVLSDEYASVQPQRAELVVSIATTQEEIREVQRLRYRVFSEAFQLSELANSEALNIDEFDAYCDHLVVRDTKTSAVVGTYRLMNPTAARRMGHYYSEKEFDLSGLESLRTRTVEAGHACVHPEYRSGSVIMMLWSGLARYMVREDCDHLMGCASVSLSDGGHNAAALFRGFTPEQMAPADYRVAPHEPFPVYEYEPGHVPRLPPLLKGYLRSGGWVCGEPAWDKEFNVADFFMLLPLSKLDSRYARHYLKPQKSF